MATQLEKASAARTHYGDSDLISVTVTVAWRSNCGRCPLICNDYLRMTVMDRNNGEAVIHALLDEIEKLDH